MMTVLIKGKPFELGGVIFDMDGTLLDSLPEWRRTAEHFLRKYAGGGDAEAVGKFMTETLGDAAEYVTERFSPRVTAERLAREISGCIGKSYRRCIPLKPSADRLLKRLRENGVKMAVATASERCHAEDAFARLGIADYFEGIVTCTEVGAGKSSPDVYEAALGLLGTPKEHTAVAEDSARALLTAKRAGFTVIGVYDAFERDTETMKRKSDLYLGADIWF